MSNPNETQELTTLEPSAVIPSDILQNSENTRPLPAHMWRPGQSGNPAGRPKHDVSAQICKAIVEKHGQALENALVRMCRKDYKAIKFVFERAYGKLPQPVEHAGADGGPIEIVIASVPGWVK